MRSVLRLIAPLLLLASTFGFGQSHVVIDTDEYHYSASFDPSRISEEHLRGLLVFSPYDFGVYGWKIGQEQVSTSWSKTPGRLQKTALANRLELCVERDPRYLPCGKRDISEVNFFANADINMRINEASLAALNAINVPDELRSIWQEFRNSLSFYSTIERRRLEYLRTDDVGVLSAPLGNIDPSAECKEEIRKLNLATTLQQRYTLSLYGWSNCLNSVWDRISPAYPQQD